MKRRQFIKKMFASLVFVGSGLKAMVVQGESGLPLIDSEDMPPMSSVKPPKVFGKDSMSFVGTDDYIEVSEDDVKIIGDFTINIWHHFVYNRVGNEYEMFMDGKQIFPIGISTEDCDIINFRRTQVGKLVEEEFWFRNKENA